MQLEKKIEKSTKLIDLIEDIVINEGKDIFSEVQPDQLCVKLAKKNGNVKEGLPGFDTS